MDIEKQMRQAVSKTSCENFNYIEEAHVTASDKYHGERVSLAYFEKLLGFAIDVLSDLDAVKKTLFYGRDNGIAFPNEGEASLLNLPLWILNNSRDDGKAINVIHAIIGKATEAGELLECLRDCLNGERFDKINTLEEVGDGFWYDALLLKALNSNFDEAQRVNIAKLRLRFPDSFTEHDANNRNLTEERKILEQKA